MSKYIKITEAEIENLKNDFFEALKNAKLANGKFTFSKDVGTIDKRARLFFEEKAWLKQQALVREFNDEVAWHGIAKRGEGEDDYIIEDILVYPQEVTGATVTTDQEKYQNWLYQQEDEVFNNIRMQGHSHVNMGVTPSGVDESLYEGILEQLEDDMFYIFLIWNKRGDKTIKIYDFGKNILFETKDVDVNVMDDVIGLDAFLDDSRNQVSRKTVATQASKSTTATKKKDSEVSWNRNRRSSRGSGYYSDSYSDYYYGKIW